MSSILKVIKAFKKDAEYLPIDYPTLPRLEVKADEATEAQTIKIKEDFQAYENDFYKTVAENDARFEIARERINLCSFLTGFLNPLSQTPINERSHFKWCPHDQWMKHSRSELFRSAKNIAEKAE